LGLWGHCQIVRILSITAGAANMYCGSCLRDNALARALMDLGHDVTLMPVYTPTRADEQNVSEKRVFFGGVSVFLEQHLRLFRKTPWLVDRLWESTGFLNQVSKRSIQVNPSGLGALTISTLLGEQGFQRKEIEKLVYWLRGEPAYDLINLPNSLLISLAEPIRRATGRPVCVTLQGEDLFLEGLPPKDRARSLELIRQHVPHVDRFLSVSHYYRDFAAGYLGIPEDRIDVTPLGVSVDDLVPGERTRMQSDPFVVGFLARIAPEKSLHLLAEAYRVMRHDRGLPPSRLEVAGYLAPEHQSYLDGVERRMQEWGLGEEFRYHGELDRAAKVQFLHSIDVLSVPSVYVEPKGLYLLEAMSCGVPVVAPNHGAFPEMLALTGGGLLAKPGDASSFADGIMAVRDHPGQAREMGWRGAAGVREHYTVRRMAERVIEAYEAVVGSLSGNATVPQESGSH
jgi:glycosyltransferase involved in cell wall biosynthesis